jgi:hypothetical protein
MNTITKTNLFNLGKFQSMLVLRIALYKKFLILIFTRYESHNLTRIIIIWPKQMIIRAKLGYRGKATIQ